MSSLRGKAKFNSEKYVNWLCILQHESSITRSVVSSNLRSVLLVTCSFIINIYQGQVSILFHVHICVVCHCCLNKYFGDKYLLFDR